MWPLFALGSAFFTAVNDASIKSATRKGGNVYRMAAVVPLFIGAATFLYQVLTSDVSLAGFFNRRTLPWLAFALPLEITGTILYYLAVASSPMSLALPFLTFTPVLVPLVSYLLLGEGVPAVVFLAILMVFAGSYLLFFERGTNVLEPFRRFFKEKGSMMMFAVAVIYSFTSVIGRKLVLLSGVANMSAFYPVTDGLLTTLVIVLLGKLKDGSGRGDAKIGRQIVIGILASSVSLVCHFIAIAQVNAAYMISVKRLSVLFGMIFSAVLFKDKFSPLRYAAAVLMIAGVILIVFLGRNA